MVIWLTGLSGAGKSTVAGRLFSRFKPRVPELVLVDGDEVRALFGNTLGYAEPDRRLQIERIQRLAGILDAQRMLVVVSALYAHPDLLAWNRANFDAYLEVYLEASIELVKQRDPKGLYARVAGSRECNIVGLDIPWHAPAAPDIRVDMRTSPAVDEIVDLISARVPRLAGSR